MLEVIIRHTVRQVRKEFSDMRFKTYMYGKRRAWLSEIPVNYLASMEGQVYV